MVVRKRLIFWLIKAYIKKSGKTLLLSFLLGLFIFFALLFGWQYVSKLIPVYKKASIGMVGAYTRETLPAEVLGKLSQGLTIVEADGSINPGIAKSWEIKDSGKTYTFHLHEDLTFTDGTPVTSDMVNYNFSDVQVERPDEKTITFKLQDRYAPFLITVSRPIFHNGFTGTSDYRIGDINLNGNFVQTMTIAGVNNRFDTIRYQFYPSEEALQMAYLLGEITEAKGLSDMTFRDTSLTSFSNTEVQKAINPAKLVTLFYHTEDNILSDKKIRNALSYALPENYPNGQKTYLPYDPASIFYNHDLEEKSQDYEHARLLLDASSASSESGELALNLTIKTLPKYKTTAEQISNSWKEIGITTTIEEVESVPSQFQIFLGDFSVPRDPDQYSLWHSDQGNNITKYKNLRIDKLLEDGRKTVATEDRKEIYMDFQRYLMEDSPASFLYFPYEYTLKRK